jgi:hypothetical protein
MGVPSSEVYARHVPLSKSQGERVKRQPTVRTPSAGEFFANLEQATEQERE